MTGIMTRLARARFAAVGALVAVAGLALSAAPAQAQPTSSAHAQFDGLRLRVAAERALAYLGTQQSPDGSLLDTASVTEDYILGTAASGRSPNTLISSSGNSVYSFLASDISDATSDANRTGKLVQALVAGHRNPANFAGENILGLLEGPGSTAGGFYDPATGSFNDGGINAAYHQANAILGLVAAHNPAYPVTAKAVHYLESLQDTTVGDPGYGGWQYTGLSNTNSTAIALMALASVGDQHGFTAAFAFLHTQQDAATGGFTYSTLGEYGSPVSDPDSDALVIQGLVAAGQQPGSPAWTNSSGNALTDILTFQDPATGGFSFLPGTPPDAFTTSQVPAGLLRAPFPIPPPF
jgi:hypothetical protein